MGSMEYCLNTLYTVESMLISWSIQRVGVSCISIHHIDLKNRLESMEIVIM